MQTHVKVLGVLFLISSAFLALLAIGFPIGLGFVGAWAGRSDNPDAATSAAVLGLVGTGVALVFGLLAVVWGICGYGVIKHQPWARIAAIVLSAMSLVQLPIGTALGIYGLWVMFRKDTEALFTKSPQAS